MNSKRRRVGPAGKHHGAAENSFQPCSERDLQRFPPVSGECLRIRAMLRDYCDGELTNFLHDEVDGHVHDCRDCGLALSRHELEVMRLGSAYEEERCEAGAVPPGLTLSVMAGLKGVEVDDRPAVAGDGPAPAPQGFTGRVMDRVRMEWRPSHSHARFLAFMRKGLFLVPIAAVVLISVLFWSTLLTKPMVVPVYRLESLTQGRLSVQDEDGDWLPIPVVAIDDTSMGMVLPIGTRLEIGEGGAGSILFENGEGVVELRATLESETIIQLADGRLEIVRGAVAIDGSAWLRVASLGDVHLLESTPGSEVHGYLALTSVQRPDHVLVAEDSLRLRIAVEFGKAEIWRGGERLQTVLAGQVAELDDWSGIRVESALTPQMLAGSRQNGLRPGRDPFLPGPSSWVGGLRDSLSGEGLAGVDVEMSSAWMQVTLTTGADGSFLVPNGFLRGELVVLRVRSQENTRGYASYGPEAIDLRHLRAGQLPVIELIEDHPVSGLLRSSDRRSLAAAQILPVVVDELLQLVDPLQECATQSDAEGRFVLRGLPLNLPAHQRLSLVVEHLDYPTSAFLDLGRRQRDRLRSGLDLVMESGRERQLFGLPAGENCAVFATVSGLPRRALAVRHELRADRQGVAVIANAGAGPFWYLDASQERLIELAQAPEQVAFSMPIPDGSPLGHRYAWPRSDSVGAVADAIASLVVQDELQSMAVPGARLFMRIGSARPVYLGRYDGSSALQFRVPRDRSYALFGVSQEGDFGVLASTMLPDPSLGGVAALSLQRTGSVRLTTGVRADADSQPGLGEPLLLRFLRLDGILAGNSYWRLLGELGDWRAGQLPVGRYRILGPSGVVVECSIGAGAETKIVYSGRR